MKKTNATHAFDVHASNKLEKKLRKEFSKGLKMRNVLVAVHNAAAYGDFAKLNGTKISDEQLHIFYALLDPLFRFVKKNDL